VSDGIVWQSGHLGEALYNILSAALSKHAEVWQDAEKVRQLRSRLTEILNVPPEGTPPVSIRLRPCWTAFEHPADHSSTITPHIISTACHAITAFSRKLFESKH
jgi:hypothetical protein